MDGTSANAQTRGPYAAGEADAYWEPLWQSRHRYRSLNTAERETLHRQVGAGRGRPALDIGSGDGTLVQALAEQGFRPTGIDCAPSALSAARHRYPTLDFRQFDIDTGDLSQLPEPAFELITCRLVYRWVPDKYAFLSRVRQLLAPDGTFWVATSVRSSQGGEARPWEIDGEESELLTFGWSRAEVIRLDDTYRCFSLRP